ncbi:ATP-dependent zinc protease family protein [Lyngbya confervoides]|uniref:RimK/LysX family protein n=1 Tax=Lyngbya confervoides BDU141951 TaxID=1574623 RepID=A0ABD4SZM1_9CYAN|nr:RimK/LysX family protein [Lyngbya confervoides]MCM1981565.1 RimK/LysX family protein [Lyngbya confervoides BDU141951]
MSQPHSPSVAPSQLSVIGWREWVALPELGVPHIKAKIDTGARTSALHAFDVDFFEIQGRGMVRFTIHPQQRDTRETLVAQAPLLEHREVRNSGGQAQRRPVILTPVRLGDRTWTIELTLTNRDVMGFRMLLGRQAVRRQFLVDPGRSYLG